LSTFKTLASFSCAKVTRKPTGLTFPPQQELTPTLIRQIPTKTGNLALMLPPISNRKPPFQCCIEQFNTPLSVATASWFSCSSLNATSRRESCVSYYRWQRMPDGVRGSMYNRPKSALATVARRWSWKGEYFTD